MMSAMTIVDGSLPLEVRGLTLTKSPYYQIKRSFLDAVFECMELDPSEKISIQEDYLISTLDRNTWLAVTLPAKYIPLFFVTVSMVYCDLEHSDIRNVPEWTPGVMASFAQQVHRRTGEVVLVFPDFKVSHD